MRITRIFGFGFIILLLLIHPNFTPAQETSFTGRGPAPDGEWISWFRQPAQEWVEALPVGNGRMGAMVFGGYEKERIQLNEESLWDGYNHDTTNPQALEALPEVRRLIFEGKNEEARELADKTMLSVPPRIKSYQTLGDLYLEFPEVKTIDNYARWLDMDRGIVVTDYTADGIHYTREVFASHPHQVIVIRLTASQPGAISTTVSLERERDSTVRTLGGNRLQLFGQITRPSIETGENMGLKYECQVDVQTEGGETTRHERSIEISNADSVTLYIAADTNHQGTSAALINPRANVEENLDNALEENFDTLRQLHIIDHQSLFRRVDIELGGSFYDRLPTDLRVIHAKRGKKDPGLAELYFQFGRYLLIACSRPGDLPANLQGIWNHHFEAPWQSDYHTNINLQMNYWPAEVTNLSELHRPLFDWMKTLVESGRYTAKKHYGAGGWTLHHLSNIFGFTTPADGVWGIWPMGAAWLCQHPYEHYLYTQDEEFLRETAYPMMKEAAIFIQNFLIEGPDGYLVTNPSHSPENAFISPSGEETSFTYAATMDIQIILDLFENCIEASKILNIDREFRESLITTMEQLPPLQISPETGRLQEWIKDYEEANPGHRHISHLYGVHPGHSITHSKTPDLMQAARKSLESRLSHGGGHTGWSRAWIINFWARFHEGNLAHDNVKALFAKSTLSNLFDTHPPFQIDGNFGGTAGIAEMLLQSHQGYIEVLPALPDAWPTGSFTGLKARGGHVIDCEWENKEITSLTLHATTDAPCFIKPPEGREFVSATSDGQSVSYSEVDGIIRFQPIEGKTYQVNFN